MEHMRQNLVMHLNIDKLEQENLIDHSQSKWKMFRYFITSRTIKFIQLTSQN